MSSVLSHPARIAALRQAMARLGLDAYLVPVNDRTLGETPPPHARRLAWLTGFTGSAGTAVVMKDRAALFADGRYTLQAANQVGAFMEVLNPADMTPAAWLAQALPDGGKVGCDAWLFSHAQAERMALACPQVEWVADQENVIDTLWDDRPADPLAPAVAWPLDYAGASRAEKEAQIAKGMAAKGLDAFLLTNPESPCWLLNLRGADLPTTPILNCAALLVRAGEALNITLFVAPRKISEELRSGALAGVQIAPEEALPAALAAVEGVLGLDPAATPRAVTLARKEWKAAEDPCLLPRATKHAVEQEGMREAHRRDGAALAEFLCELDGRIARQDFPTEVEIDELLLSFRRKQAEFWGPSFETIAGFGANGAIVHYRAEEATAKRLGPGNLLLLDSGGQYPMGTTDVTRTLAIGTPTGAMRAFFTRVLAGHIALGMARFPRGTAGSALDALARNALWQMEADYDHGTGHGVGTFLNVHEGPQRISKRGGDAALVPGMVISNEPGYYAAGQFGIRIESLVLVKACPENDRFLEFETLTCVPIDRRLIAPELLTPEARTWLDAYHHWVETTLAPRVDAITREWLKKACAPL